MTDEFTGPEPGTEQRPPGAHAPGEAMPTRREETGLSSVEVDTTARGVAMVKVRVYAVSNDPQAVQQAADNAVDLYRQARGKLAQMARSEQW